MDVRALLISLRDGREPAAEEILDFARALASAEVSDAQVGAFAMAVYMRGLSDAGRVALTLGMRDSGEVLAWESGAPVLDKHSTGGLGDAVSIVLAPALAACGVRVPMVSGRGLGHSGGTLDKLEAIRGVSTQVSEEKLRAVVAEAGCAIVGANSRIAPADQRLYAIRDITGCVESRDLITSSILSKKLAAGLEGLVMDVKVGSGAFMRDMASAQALASSLVRTANGAGCRTTALITNMDEPLCAAMGASAEIALCMEVLEGNIAAAPRLYELVLALGAELIGSPEPLAEAIASGRALTLFARMISELGGPADFAQNWRDQLPVAPVQLPVCAAEAGYVAGFAGVALGFAVVDLGGGRRVETDEIDHAVGFQNIRGLGEYVAKGEPLLVIHAADMASAERAKETVLASVQLSDQPVTRGPLILERVI